MTVDIYSPTAHDALSLQELALWRAIMAYRAEHGLPAIPLSRALTATAGRHVLDTRENIWAEGETPAPGTNYHSWSDAPYPSDGSNPEVMWFAPDRLGTGYADPGYEITALGYASGAAALEGWKASPAHDAILLNSGPWADLSFAAIGIGLETAPGPGPFAGRVFHVWFGEAADSPPPIRGTARGEAIRGTRFADRLEGLGGDDRIAAGRGHDLVAGGRGDDVLVGGQGNDPVVGGAGDDTMTGGPGADVFVFRAAGDRDRIADFRPGEDRMHLAGIDADTGQPGDQAFRFIGARPFDGTPGQLAWRNGVVSGDTDGDGRADFAIEIAGAVPLAADDFLL